MTTAPVTILAAESHDRSVAGMKLARSGSRSARSTRSRRALGARWAAAVWCTAAGHRRPPPRRAAASGRAQHPHPRRRPGRGGRG